MHTLTRESQEVGVGVDDLNSDAVADGDEAVKTLMALTSIPHCGQLNITNSTLPRC
jgi:hypothetical protein